MIYDDLEAIPDESYGLILCDCPWGFTTYSKKRTIPQRKPNQHYKTMTHDEMRAMGVNRIMKKDSVLIMWCISSHIHHALALGEAWGLTFKSLGIIWCKELNGRDRDQFGLFPPEPKFRIGMGYYFRQEAEISLVFTKGKPKRLKKDVRQLIVAPRGRHSEKPEEAYTRVVRMFDGAYLDMFSRKERHGWDAFGDEVEPLEPQKL